MAESDEDDFASADEDTGDDTAPVLPAASNEKVRAEQEREEKEREERERLEKEKIENERLEREKMKEKAENERVKKEKVEREKAEKEKMEKNNKEEEAQKKKLSEEKERSEKKREKEKAEKDTNEKRQISKEKADDEKVENQKTKKKKEEQDGKKQEKTKATPGPVEGGETDMKRDTCEDREGLRGEDSEIHGDGLSSPAAESSKQTVETTPGYRQRLSSREVHDAALPVEEVRDPRSALERLTAGSKQEEGSGCGGGGGGGGGGWGNLSSWGSSVLTSATSSVNTLTNQVGSGINQVLQSVETGFSEQQDEDETSTNNDPVAESRNTAEKGETAANSEVSVITKQVDNVSLADSLVQTDQSQSEKGVKEQERGEEEGDGWFASWGLPSVVGDVVHKTTNVVQSTVQHTTSASKKVVTGGLDVLETIGKKTFDILTEGDHGLKKVIERSRDKSNLSHTLREAKEEAERQAEEEEAYVDSRRTNFSAQFDDHNGLVQLEALEMLSGSSESRLKKVLEILAEESSESITTQLIDIKMTFNRAVTEDPDEEGSTQEQKFSDEVMNYRGLMPLTLDTHKLLTAHGNIVKWLDELSDAAENTEKSLTARDIHSKSIQSLASLTAATVEHFHRASQLVLQSPPPSAASCQTVALCLTDLTVAVCREVSQLTSRFVSSLMSIPDSSSESATEVITNIYLESGNSSTYIRDAFQLVLPVLQLSIVRADPSCKDLTDN